MLPPLLIRLGRLLGLDERRCAACHMPFAGTPGSVVCAQCLEHIALRRALCPGCGNPLPLFSSPSMDVRARQPLWCGQCLMQPPPWVRMHVLGLHRDTLRDLLLRVKYRGDRGLAYALGVLIAERILAAGGTEAEAVIPMPLHPSRLRQRGFNQCHDLAGGLAGRLGIPRRSAWATRRISSQPQTGLSRKERLRNLDGVFSASAEAAGKRILILDDTMTTGASLRRLSESLLEAGAAQVEAAAIAVTVLDDSVSSKNDV